VTAPVHLVAPGRDQHGVTVLARQLAGELGASTVEDVAAAGSAPAVHVHLTDRLFGETPAAAARAVAALARRTAVTVTLHDVPQPGEGPAFPARRAGYAAVLATGVPWVVSSESERTGVERWCEPVRPGHVIPLPIVPLSSAPGPASPGRADPTVGLFGWVYPGKGHELALRAVARVDRTAGERPGVVAIGRVPDHHRAYEERLDRIARKLGVDLTLTGWVDDDELGVRLASVAVPLAGHVNVSASGSINTWLSAGRRPLVRQSPYTREMARLRPGTLELYPRAVTPAELAERLTARLSDPASGDLTAVSLRPSLADVAERYVRWWRAA
jgi:glycosyltransferase involved in cell wall biosynthesis